MMLEVLLISTSVLLFSLLCFGGATAVLIHAIVPLVRDDRGFWMSVAVMMGVTLTMLVTHFIAITLWAMVFLLCGEIATLEAALYFSAENYTALGYGDIVLSERWRMLGPLEAVNGLLLIALSTAGMVTVLNRLVAIRLRRQGGSWAAPWNPFEESRSAGDGSLKAPRSRTRRKARKAGN